MGIFIIWLNGIIAKMKGFTKYYQVNTEKRYTVLSIFFLGRRLMNDKQIKPSNEDYAAASRQLSVFAQTQANFVGIC
jgi:hypothetical protein